MYNIRGSDFVAWKIWNVYSCNLYSAQAELGRDFLVGAHLKLYTWIVLGF